MVKVDRVFFIQLMAWIAVACASLVTFALQPLAGKYFLPEYGGTSVAWLTQVFFFQSMLFLGYFLAGKTVHLGMNVQINLMCALALAAVFLIRIPPVDTHSGGSPLALLLELILSFSPALLFTTSVGIVLHRWIRTLSTKTPYYLYALSNAASLSALLLYPFLIETLMGLKHQSILLRALLGGAAIALCGVALAGKKELTRGGERQEALEPEFVPMRRRVLWTGLSFLANLLMLSVMTLLSGELGSNALTWLLPLGLFLVTYSIAFAGWVSGVIRLAAVFGLLISSGLYALMHGLKSEPMEITEMLLLLAVTFFGALGANSLLYDKRPLVRFQDFYLAQAIGGLLAGLFASLVLPMITSRVWEFHASCLALLCLMGWSLSPQRPIAFRSLLALGMLLPMLGISVAQLTSPRSAQSTIYLRSFYGVMQLEDHEGVRILANASTLHGSQLQTPEEALLPTLYYAEMGSLGRMIRVLQYVHGQSLATGVIGMGIGTLTAYNRDNDRMTLWEINPQVIEVAETAFTWLKHAKGTIDCRSGDGRLGLSELDHPLNLLVIDAFSGDAVPIHLLTVEAFETYRQHTPGGIIACHISNRYVALEPVIRASAEAIGWKAFIVHTSVPEDSPASSSTVAFVYAPEAQPGIHLLQKVLHSREGKPASYRADAEGPEARRILWTDDRHAIIEVIDMGRKPKEEKTSPLP